jgi:Secretion system C-terminal sorting domain
MRLFKIRLSRVSASLFMALLTGSISLLPSRLAAQTCTGTLQSSTQTFTYPGNGTDEFNPGFTQYNPPAGYALIAAAISSTISLVESVALTNGTNPTQTNVHPGVYDNDEVTISGNLLGTGGSIPKSLPFINVPTNTTVTDGPSTLYTNYPMSYDSVTTASSDLNDFVGTGIANVLYINAATVSINNTIVSQTPSLSMSETLSLTYYYCYTGTLAVNLLNFTATLENPQTVLLNWLTTGETPGEKYVIQVSSGNGTDFLNADTVLADGVAGNGNYAYQYTVPPADKGNLYFRIQMIDANGTVSYSPLRVINLGNGAISSFLIYPNPPSTFINLAFPGNTRNWQVQIFAANGDLVQQNNFYNTNLATVNFNNKMAAGAYFVRAIDPQSNDHYSGSFVIRD